MLVPTDSAARRAERALRCRCPPLLSVRVAYYLKSIYHFLRLRVRFFKSLTSLVNFIIIFLTHSPRYFGSVIFLHYFVKKKYEQTLQNLSLAFFLEVSNKVDEFEHQLEQIYKISLNFINFQNRFWVTQKSFFAGFEVTKNHSRPSTKSLDSFHWKICVRPRVVPC